MARTFDKVRIDLSTRPSGDFDQHWVKVHASFREDNEAERGVTVEFAMDIPADRSVSDARQLAMEAARDLAKSFVVLSAIPVEELIADEAARLEAYDGVDQVRSAIST